MVITGRALIEWLSMKFLLSLVLIWISSGLAATAQQPGKADLELKLSAPKTTVKAGSNVYLKIQMTNTSDHPVDCSTFYVGGTDRRFRVEVRDAAGNRMKKKNLHPEMMPGSFAPCTLQPGGSTSRDELVSWANDLTHPGVYTIQVARVVGQNEHDLVHSNIITITVIP